MEHLHFDLIKYMFQFVHQNKSKTTCLKSCKKIWMLLLDVKFVEQVNLIKIQNKKCQLRAAKRIRVIRIGMYKKKTCFVGKFLNKKNRHPWRSFNSDCFGLISVFWNVKSILIGKMKCIK